MSANCELSNNDKYREFAKKLAEMQNINNWNNVWRTASNVSQSALTMRIEVVQIKYLSICMSGLRASQNK